jgi:hypothetical protein
VSGTGFSEELRASAATIWEAQHTHPFVVGIGEGTLELERFAWGGPDRLQVSGKFTGLGEVPPDAPVLVVCGPQRTHRLPALPDSLSGSREDGNPWSAEFAWQEPPVAFEEATLELGPDWTEVGSGRTGDDGRIAHLGSPPAAGSYRLRFDTGAYFRAQELEGLYPEVSVRLEVAEGRENGGTYLTVIEQFHHVRPDEEGDRLSLLGDGLKLYMHIYRMHRSLDDSGWFTSPFGLLPGVTGDSECGPSTWPPVRSHSHNRLIVSATAVSL